MPPEDEQAFMPVMPQPAPMDMDIKHVRLNDGSDWILFEFRTVQGISYFFVDADIAARMVLPRLKEQIRKSTTGIVIPPNGTKVARMDDHK